jgi:hypothetical protein
MFELLTESFRIPNLPVTVFLLIIILYWIVNLVGVFDLDMLHADAEVGHDVDTDGHGHDSWFGNIFDFGDVPVAIVISFFSLFFWMGTIICNYYLGNSSLVLALVIYIPNIILAFVITRAISIPLSRLYKLLNAHTEEESIGDFTGSVCVVIIEAGHTSMGQGEINRKGDVFRVNIKTYPDKNLSKGQSALLIEYHQEKGYYIAEPYDQVK